MKKLIKFLIVFLILNSSLLIHNCQCQWMHTNGYYGGTVYAFATLGNNIFAGAWNYPEGTGGIYLSANNGVDWSQIALDSVTVYSFAVLGNNIFAGTSQNGVYLSTNNGINWIQTGLDSINVYSLATLGNNIFAGTLDSGIYFSTNNGANWTQTSLNTQSVYSFAITENNIFAGTFNIPTGYMGIYRSTNIGINWSQSGLTNYIVSAFAVNGNNIFAGTGSGNGVWLSTNNSANWTQTTLNNKSVKSLAVLGNNIFAGIWKFYTDSGGVYYSSNNGSAWIKKDQGFNVIPAVRALLITNNYIFAGTEGNSIWRRPLSDFIGIKQISVLVPASYSLSQNYPNPFNPVSKIRYALPRAGFVKLIVFDALGREVETLVNEHQSAGTYEATFNASEYSSGVYFYRLITDNFSETKKMLIIK